MTHLTDALRHFASIPDHATAEGTPQTANLIADLISEGLVVLRFTAHEVTYELTPKGMVELNATKNV